MKKFNELLDFLKSKGYFKTHQIIQNLNEIEHESLSYAERLADKLAEAMGS